MSEITANSLKKAYLEGVREKRATEDDGDVTLLPMKKRGRPILGEVLDRKVQKYLVRVRDGGGVVSARTAMATARGILMSCNQSRLVEFGGDVQLHEQAVGLLAFEKNELCQMKGNNSQEQALQC